VRRIDSRRLSPERVRACGGSWGRVSRSGDMADPRDGSSDASGSRTSKRAGQIPANTQSLRPGPARVAAFFDPSTHPIRPTLTFPLFLPTKHSPRQMAPIRQHQSTSPPEDQGRDQNAEANKLKRKSVSRAFPVIVVSVCLPRIRPTPRSLPSLSRIFVPPFLVLFSPSN
jgi:hypothetical protein